MNANELADELERHCLGKNGCEYLDKAATLRRQQQAEIEALNQRIERMIENQSHHEGIAHAGGFEAGYQAAKAKTLTDEQFNKAFEYYCETDEGVLRFNYELREEWKQEQLIRWKQAFEKAQEK